MARSNLAEIDRSFEETVGLSVSETALAAVAAKAGPGVKRLAGFMIPDPVVAKKAVTARKARVDQYRQDRDALVATLSKLGVTPLAMVPLKAWNRLCRDAGLYRFTPDEDGQVRVSTDKVRMFERIATGLNIAAWIVVESAIFAGWYWCVRQFGVSVGDAIGVTALTAGITLLLVNGLLFCAGFNGAPYLASHSKLTRLCLRIGGKMPWRRQLRWLFPEGHGIDPREYQANRASVTLLLPPPPDDVITTLSKITSLTPHLAVEPGGFRLAEPLPVIFRKIVDDRAREREVVWSAWADPIVYVVQGKAVAVVAQFGEFPIEQAVVERVASVETLF